MVRLTREGVDDCLQAPYCCMLPYVVKYVELHPYIACRGGQNGREYNRCMGPEHSCMGLGHKRITRGHLRASAAHEGILYAPEQRFHIVLAQF